jgi:two-component system response regulator GlrR
MEAIRGAMHGTEPGRYPTQRILVADDDPASLDGLRSLLEAWGYEVETARDGRAALDQVPLVHPSVVITDVVMPRMTGLELLEAIRRELPSIPVIVMTAHGTLETRRRAAAQGAVAYLPKPVDTTRLKSVLLWTLHEARGDVEP